MFPIKQPLMEGAMATKTLTGKGIKWDPTFGTGMILGSDKKEYETQSLFIDGKSIEPSFWKRLFTLINLKKGERVQFTAWHWANDSKMPLAENVRSLDRVRNGKKIEKMKRPS